MLYISGIIYNSNNSKLFCRVLLDSLEDLNNHKDNLEVEFQEIVFKLKQIVIPHLHQSVTEVFVCSVLN